MELYTRKLRVFVFEYNVGSLFLLDKHAVRKLEFFIFLIEPLVYLKLINVNLIPLCVTIFKYFSQI